MYKILPFIACVVEFRIDNLFTKRKSRKFPRTSPNLPWLYMFFLDARQTLVHLNLNIEQSIVHVNSWHTCIKQWFVVHVSRNAKNDWNGNEWMKRRSGFFLSGVIIINMDVQIFIVVSILIDFFFVHILCFFFLTLSYNRWHKKCDVAGTHSSLISNIKNPRQDSETYTSNYQRNENEERQSERERG